MLQITGQIARRLASARPSAALAAACSTQAAENKHFDVPAGHEHSDLRPAKAHIGLNRRRDLSLRADISVYRGAECVTLRDWLRVRALACGLCCSQGCPAAAAQPGRAAQGGTSVIFGLPDMGKACSEIHAPGFVNLVRAVAGGQPGDAHGRDQCDARLHPQVDDFKAVGVDQIWAVAIGDPEKVDGWARKTKLSEGRVRAWRRRAPAGRCAALNAHRSADSCSGRQDRRLCAAAGP